MSSGTDPHASRMDGDGPRYVGSSRRGRVRRRASGLAVGVLMIAAIGMAGKMAAVPLPDRAAPRVLGEAVEVGYRDFAYGSSVTAPTGMKPESKLWYTQDNIWWGSLFNRFTRTFEIHKFDRSAQSWSTTGRVIDARRMSQADTLYDASTNKLYVVSHVKDTATSSLETDITIKFMRYTYGAGSYTLDPGFPVEVATVSPDGAVFDRDSTGAFWITWTEPNGAGGRKVRVTHSTTDAAAWVAPYDLALDHAANLSSEDMSTLVAYRGEVGILWGNQNDGTLNFATHRDGAPETTWDSSVLCDSNTFGHRKCPDNHSNVKSLEADGTGRVFAIVKTALNEVSSLKPNDPLEIIWQFDPAKRAWTRSTVWTVADDVTRAITLLDTSNREIYAFAAARCCGGGVIYVKKSSYDSLSFPPGLGTPFIRSSLDRRINNVTSTKQSVNSNTGLLVLAGDDSTRYYLHNYLPLRGDTGPSSGTATASTAGATGVSTTGTTVRHISCEPTNAATITRNSVTLRI